MDMDMDMDMDMGICHGPSQKRPPASAAGDTHTEYTQRVKSIKQASERGVLDRAQRHYRAFLPGFLERGILDRAQRGTIVSTSPVFFFSSLRH